MKRLLTVWLGEYGAEMSYFVPELKKVLRENYKEDWFVYSASYRGREIFYRDVADVFVPIDLTKEQQEKIHVGRLNGWWLPEGEKKWPEVTTEGYTLKLDKWNTIKEASVIFMQLLRKIRPTHYITSNSQEIPSLRASFFNSTGIYEHLVTDEFEPGIEGPYVVVVPRTLAKTDNLCCLTPETWSGIMDLLLGYNFKVLYFPFSGADKQTYILEDGIDITTLPGCTRDNHVSYQAYLMRNAKFVFGAATGGMLLGFFAPAQKMIIFYDPVRYGNWLIDVKWQKDLLGDNLILHPFDFSEISISEFLGVLESDIKSLR